MELNANKKVRYKDRGKEFEFNKETMKKSGR